MESGYLLEQRLVLLHGRHVSEVGAQLGDVLSQLLLLALGPCQALLQLPDPLSPLSQLAKGWRGVNFGFVKLRKGIYYTCTQLYMYLNGSSTIVISAS